MRLCIIISVLLFVILLALGSILMFALRPTPANLWWLVVVINAFVFPQIPLMVAVKIWLAKQEPVARPPGPLFKDPQLFRVFFWLGVVSLITFLLLCILVGPSIPYICGGGILGVLLSVWAYARRHRPRHHLSREWVLIITIGGLLPVAVMASVLNIEKSFLSLAYMGQYFSAAFFISSWLIVMFRRSFPVETKSEAPDSNST